MGHPRSRLLKRQVRWWLVRFLYRVADILGKSQRLLRPAPALAPNDDAIRRILIIRLDLLGDLVMTLPAVEAVRARWPLAHIAVLCTPAAREIAARGPAVDQVYTYNPNVVRSLRWWLKPSSFLELYRVIGRLRSARFDLALSMFGEFACLFAWASNARHRVGYAHEGYPALLTLAVHGRRYALPLGHEVQWNEHLAAAAGAPSIHAVPRLPAPADQADWQAQFRRAAAVGPAGYVVLAPGAHNGSAKRYRLDGWAIVANALQREYGVRLVLSGAPSELALAEQLAALLDTPPFMAVGETTLPQLLSLLAGARLLLSGDSGPVHLAAALGAPVVVAFGPTDPRTYRPYTERATVLRSGIACSPCYDLRSTAECRLGYAKPLCMELLPASRVLAAARHWLDAAAPATTARAGSLEQVQDLVLPLGAG